MPPGVRRAFGFWSTEGEEVVVDGPDGGKWGVGCNYLGVESKYKGIGSAMGMVSLESGEVVDAGRLLMRGSWNADLYPPLKTLYEEGRTLEDKPDVWIHKNRMSGLWGSRTPLQDFLSKEGITTLLFSGVNTDQCVGGTLTDAFSKGFDCVLLSDGCGTSSPGFAQECWEFNAARTFGFCMSCEELGRGVEGMK